jgi:hypothetical protein
MPVTYYPAQILTVAKTGVNGADGQYGQVQLELIQSADVDFAISRQDVFEFGNLYAVDNIQIEPATVTLNFSYALSSGSGVTPTNASKLGMDNFDTFLSEAGRNYGISGAGTLLITSGIVKTYSVDGSVGNIPTVSVSVDATNATYTAANPVFKGSPGFSGTNTVASIIQPRDITVQIGTGAQGANSAFEARSFTFALDIPRNKINKLGSLTPIANILSGPPKVTVDAEIILNGTDNPKFDPNTPLNVRIACGDKDFQINNAKLADFKVTNTLDDIQVCSISLEAPVTGSDAIKIEGESGAP